jgi:DNA invertase Pin-like site-specific DNA recombinase
LPRERVAVIDDDLGKSGTSSAERYGFQRLISEIGLGKAGLVLSLDASRLARNNRDWHQLLELCTIFRVLIADGERLYEPTVYHDRLLLGLSGRMSEAELHQLRIRLHQGEQQKAARGELRVPLSGGLSRARSGEIVLHPDEQVQKRIEFVFRKFSELHSAKAVMRELRQHDLPLPVRPLRGPAPHEIAWMPAMSARVLQVLHNPAYILFAKVNFKLCALKSTLSHVICPQEHAVNPITPLCTLGRPVTIHSRALSGFRERAAGARSGQSQRRSVLDHPDEG